MKLLAFILILAAVGAVVALPVAYDFAGNATLVADPYNLLNYRYLHYSPDDVDRLGFLRSLRSENDSDSDYDEIDTIGSLVSYSALPSAFLAFWEDEAQWDNTSFDTSDADSAIMSGVSTLIERNQYGSVVRSFLLTQASSNTSVGVNWASFAGSNSDDTLVWRELRTSITASNSTSTFTFNVSITTFGASVRGRIDLGNIEITPRSLETAVKVSGYQYLDASNTLSLRVFCAYGTVGYRTQLGGIASGHSLARVYVSIDDEAQRLSNDTSHSGTNMSVSISAWQILSGLRTSVSKSVMGYMLNDKFGTNWDVIYSDVTLPCPESLEPQYSLFRISMGTGSSTINDTEPDTEIPNYPIHEPAAASTAAPLLCIVILALLAQLLL